jgi:molybdopterin molybdotransferase
MIDLADALALVESTAAPLPPRRQRLLDACGLALAEPIVADIDSPPWDRAMMDGFALKSDDVVAAGGSAVELDVVVDLAAGDVTTLSIVSGSCARIMTGAPIPAGADAVIPVECALDDTAATHAGGRVRLRDDKFRPGQHISRQGTAFRAGAEVLAAGSLLGAAEIGLAAEAGATHVVAAGRPRVAILSTGSELVPPDAQPAFGQTRNSNGPMLTAAVRLLNAEPIPLGLATDRPEAIRAAVAQGLAADVLLLSGGVSAGDLDLVPEVFRACGVEKVFHKVRHKPGKPVWFGVYRRAASAPTLVFGLPGNPASSLVCFDLFVRPALSILAGRQSRRRPAGVSPLPARRPAGCGPGNTTSLDRFLRPPRLRGRQRLHRAASQRQAPRSGHGRRHRAAAVSLIARRLRGCGGTQHAQRGVRAGGTMLRRRG